MMAAFHEPVRTWLAETFGMPTRAQELGWPVIQRGESTLILAPTGSGKTLAAFLAAIDRLLFDPVPEADARCRVLYLSPLKALAVDVEKNLRAPMAGIRRTAARMGVDVADPQVAIRTGDTPSRERAAFVRRPADILITTPESLYLLLTSHAREALRSVRCVIVDEIHAVAGTKRGAHLALSLERLEEIVSGPLQRIGLSATIRPPEEVARFLAGCAGEPAMARPVHIVDAGRTKAFDLRVEMPIDELARRRGLAVEKGAPAEGGGMWPAIYPLILDRIRAHRSTLVFVNSRRLAERVAGALNDLAGEEIVHAHHGSIAREQRLQIEAELKSGRLPAMVATSSLELGIDMGAIDLVIQVEAPPSVASAIQRIGRAGHHIGVPSKGVIIPKHRSDLLACAALADRMAAGAVEPVHTLRNPLDVLAQQIVAMVGMDPWTVDDLERVIRRSEPFARLTRGALEQVLDMLSGRYPSDAFAELRPRVTWDRNTGELRPREGSRRIAVTEGGTIPSRGLYPVFLYGSERRHGRVGELDEEMVFESRVGDTFVLGASTWRIEEIAHDRVLVSPAPGRPGRTPFWHGEAASRPLQFGQAIGALTREVLALPRDQATDRLTTQHRLDGVAARNLLDYLEDQRRATGAVPDDRTIVVETGMDEMGDWRVCILTPFGGRIHAPWAMAIGASIRERMGRETDVLWTDDGIVIRFPELEQPPPVDMLLPDAEDVERLVTRHLSAGGGMARRMAQPGGSINALFASRFREAAARALLLPRKRPGQRAPLWQQRKRASDLLHATARFRSFPIVMEAFRECLQDVFDMPALVDLLSRVCDGSVQVVSVTTRSPSPFAAGLLFHYVANFMYEGDAPAAERRAQALTVDPAQLRELLGEAELRDVLDAGALDEIETQLQFLAPERAVRHANALHDLLLRLGDLSAAELHARCFEAAPLDDWLQQLDRQGRALRVPVAGEQRWIAAEDAARYRDALGVLLPEGLPPSLLEPAPDALEDLAARYARTHRPFAAHQAAARLGIGVAPLIAALRALAESGRVVDGEFLPDGSGAEWCDAEVLRMLRRRSLARLRHEVEPVEQRVMARFYTAWHAVGPFQRATSLVEAIAQLQGVPLPASALESFILPARVPDYAPHMLDELTASGSVLWLGCEALGPNDGRVCLALAGQPVLLPRRAMPPPDGALHDAIRDLLATRGASFFPQIMQAAGGAFSAEIVDALWDLVWAGEVTNDTLQPLRARLAPARGLRRRPTPLRHRPVVVRGWPSARSLPLGGDPQTSGRWYLTRDMLSEPTSVTERLTLQAQSLLERLGLVTRETAQAAEAEGGFTAVYEVLRAMEDAGTTQRGYFVAGLGAAQFAAAGVPDRLRSLREPNEDAQPLLLASTDPANPYGAALPWPDRDDGRRPARMAGTYVVLIDGALAAWVGRGEHQVLTFGGPEHRAGVARALADLVGPSRLRAVLLQDADGVPVDQSPLAASLRDAGFTRMSRGWLRRV